MLAIWTRLPEDTFVANKQTLLRYISPPRFRANKSLTIVRANRHWLSSLRNAFIDLSLSVLTLHQDFFRTWRNYVQCHHYRRFSCPSCITSEALLKMIFCLLFFLFFFLLCFFFPSSWHLFKILILQCVSVWTLFRISTLDRCKKENAQTDEGITECGMLDFHVLETVTGPVRLHT